MSKYEKNKGTGLSSLTGVLAKSKEMAGDNPKLEIPLSKLVAHPKNAKIYKVEKIELLANSIKEHGFLGAIDVYKKDDTYVIISGHRRTEAMRFLGRETIPALVRPQPQHEYEETMILIQANRNMREKSPIETAKEIQEWMDALKQKYGITANSRVRNVNVGDETANVFGMSRRQVFNYIKLLTLVPELQELADKEAIPWKAILEAASLSEEEQKEVAKELNVRLEFFNGSDEDVPKTLNAEIVKFAIEKMRKPEEEPSRYKEENSEPEKINIVEEVNDEVVTDDEDPAFEEEQISIEQRERDYQATISKPGFLDTYNQLMTKPFEKTGEESDKVFAFTVDGWILRAAEQVSLLEQKDISEENIEDKEVVREAINQMKSIISKIEKML